MIRRAPELITHSFTGAVIWSQIDEQTRSNKFADEIRDEQEERKRIEEEKKNSRELFRKKANYFQEMTGWTATGMFLFTHSAIICLVTPLKPQIFVTNQLII